MAFQPAGELLLTGDYTGRLAAWRCGRSGPAAGLGDRGPQGLGASPAAVARPDGATVATCGNDKLVRIWNTADGKLVRELAGHESHVYNGERDQQHHPRAAEP